MQVYLVVLTFIAFLLLLVMAAIRPKHSKLNMFELERRVDQGDDNAKIALARERQIGDVVSLQRVLIAVLQVLVVLLSELTFGLYIGIPIAFLVALLYGAIARVWFIKKLAEWLYERCEKYILEFIKGAPVLVKFLRSAPMSSGSHVLHIDSRQELQHLVAESAGVLTPEEKKLIVNSLSFNDELVSKVMTPRHQIDFVKKTEFLGPLTLDDLHKLGHSRLPVVSRDIDHIVGVLHLDGLLALDIKRSTTAEKAMEPKVFYIRENQTLQHALMAFLSTRHYLFIVINSDRETVGLLTLEDVIEALLGHKIVDEYESHDSLRAVASRSLRKHNHSEKHADV
ncbi:CBS domain-containing protein [Candidatus Saccharibacteria bacterium]|nr:CBS domain-containing protein [Candidatus Saccharibacteria bacterium]